VLSKQIAEAQQAHTLQKKRNDIIWQNTLYLVAFI
jgi:hypothetical protein